MELTGVGLPPDLEIELIWPPIRLAVELRLEERAARWVVARVRIVIDPAPLEHVAADRAWPVSSSSSSDRPIVVAAEAQTVRTRYEKREECEQESEAWTCLDSMEQERMKWEKNRIGMMGEGRMVGAYYMAVSLQRVVFKGAGEMLVYCKSQKIKNWRNKSE